MEIKKLIIIGGGVGPLAGLHLHRLIIENTPNVTKDQDHLRILHGSLSDLIPDRTDALLEGAPELPGKRMAQVIAAAAQAAGALNSRPVAGVPCNTFHAPPIWEAFLAELDRLAPGVEVVHMIDRVIAALKTRFPRTGARIGLLSTTGTRSSGLYRNPLEKAGFILAEVPEERQELVHNAIYDPEWGIKATVPPSNRARTAFEGFAGELIAAGAEAIILGCTEIPLVLSKSAFQGIPLVDPMVELARGLIEA